MINARYGRLTVIEQAESSHSHKRWVCRCDCGQTTVVWQLSLRRGTTTSCGCAALESRRARWASYRAPAFWARVQRGGPTECWLWLGLQKRSPKNPSPYGSLGWRGKVTSAHRVAFELANGEPPAGAMVLHRCDNTLCCNPAHLYLGDHAQNMRDMVERQRRKGVGVGAQNGRAKLTQEMAEEIRAIYASGISQQDIADAYGVSQNAVSQVILRKRYR